LKETISWSDEARAQAKIKASKHGKEINLVDRLAKILQVSREIWQNKTKQTFHEKE
jgi:hypothetical protein